MSKSNFLIVETTNFIRRITFNNPKRKNALNGLAYIELAKVLEETAKDEKVKVAVLTGTGDYYSSGNDISNVMDPSMSPEDLLKAARSRLFNLVKAFYSFPKLLIAVVNGPAFGISCTLLGLCDVVYASDKAYFLCPFSKLGLCAEGCSSITFPKILGQSKASEMLFLNYKLTAQEAKEYNFISRIYKSGEEQKIFDEIQTYSTLPMTSIKANKNLMRRFSIEELEKANHLENDTLLELYMSPEAIEAIINFSNRKSKL